MTAALAIPPHHLPAEQSVLGALMQAPERLADIADWLTSEDFYRRDHALIFQAITEQAAKGQPVDPVTLADWFEGVELGDQVGGLAYLVTLAQTTPSAANLVAYAEIVAEKSRLRRLAEVGARIAELALAPNARAAGDVAAEAEAMLRAVQPARRGGLESIRDPLRRAYDGFCERYEGRGVLGLPWPWAALSDRVRLAPGETTVLAGRPSMGKSILGFQTALTAASGGHRVGIFSLETQTVGVVNRMLACGGRVPMAYIRRPDPALDDVILPRLTNAMRELDGLSAMLHIDDSPRLTASQIAARARRAHLRQPFGLLVVDHLHELKLPGRNRAEELGEALAELRALSRELGVPLLALAQLNRGAATEKRPPNLGDLKASGDIEEKADTVLLIHRPDYYDPADRPGLVQIEVAKARDGERGVIVSLRNDYAHMRALDWEGDMPARIAPPSSRWGKGNQSPEGRAA